MLIKTGRVFAEKLDQAIEAVRKEYGNGRLTIFECNIQPRKNDTWYEYLIELEEGKNENN